MIHRLLHLLPKPLLFALLGALGCVIGWAAGEPLLKTVKPKPQADGTAGPAPVLVFNNELTKRLQREAAKSGDVQISLMWDNRNDLDLHCYEPDDEHIYFSKKKSPSGGELDVDMNAREPYSEKPVENIYWPPGAAPQGRYVIKVHHYSKRPSETGPTPFTVGLKANGRVQEFKGTAMPGGLAQTVHEFEVRPAAPASSLAHSSTETFTKVPLKTTLVIGAWTALLATFLAFLVVGGQNLLMRRRVWSAREALKLAAGGVIAGLIAGSASQYLFALAAPTLAEKFPEATWLVKAGQVVGWMLLGLLLGAGIAGFIPNLPRLRASLGGMIGGLLGALAFLFAIKALGEVGGRLLGAVILGAAIALMVALVERLAREAALVVHWDANERTVISLGHEPVTLGSSPEAHLYLPKERGFPAETAVVTFTGGRVVLENKLTKSSHTLANGNKLEIGNIMIEIQTD